MFIKPAINATPETATPSDPHATWDLIAHVVPELPCGRRDGHRLERRPPFASHEAVVWDVMVTMMERNRPFAFVSIGDPDTEMAEVLANTLNDEAD